MNVPLRPSKVQTVGAALVLAVAAYRRYMRYRADSGVAPSGARVEGDHSIAGDAEETGAQPV
jgi:hypothetical protein